MNACCLLLSLHSTWRFWGSRITGFAWPACRCLNALSSFWLLLIEPKRLILFVYVSDPIHLPKKSGTTFWPPALIKEISLWCPSTRRQVSRSPVKVLEVVLSPFPLMIAILQCQSNRQPGESSSSRLMRSRVSIVTRTSTEWTSLVTTVARWSRNGTLWSRLTCRPRPWMVTSWECSRSLSRRRRTDRWKPLATPRHQRRRWSDKRWWRSCKPVFKSPTSKISSKSWSVEISANKFQRNAAPKSSHCRKTVALLRKLRSSRNLSSILPNLWSFTKTAQNQRKWLKPQRLLTPSRPTMSEVPLEWKQDPEIVLPVSRSPHRWLPI